MNISWKDYQKPTRIAQKDKSTPPDPTNVVPDNRRDPPLGEGYSTNIGGMCTLKHEISSPKFYELLINKELRRDTTLDLKNFYNHIKMYLSAVTSIREDLPPGEQSNKRHSELAEFFIRDRDHPSSSCNVHIYTSLGHSLLVAMTNDTCVKYSMAPQSYKVVITHAREISLCNNIYLIIH